jgi:hypothetical protein
MIVGMVPDIRTRHLPTQVKSLTASNKLVFIFDFRLFPASCHFLRLGSKRCIFFSTFSNNLNLCSLGYEIPTDSSRVQSDSQRRGRGYLVCLIWPWAEMRTHQQSPVQSSPVQSHESCRVYSPDVACFIFVSRTPVVRCDGCCFLK